MTYLTPIYDPVYDPIGGDIEPGAPASASFGAAHHGFGVADHD